MRHSDYFMVNQVNLLEKHGYGLKIDLTSMKPRRYLCEVWKKGQDTLSWRGRGSTKPQALADALMQIVITNAS